jgi:hypothetical protein
VFENRLLRAVFERKKEEVNEGRTSGWRRQHNEGLHILYTSPNIKVITQSRIR